jgi:hypothetical protein
VPLYCYRPLTSAFIGERIGLLSALESYAPAVRALQGLGSTEAYLSRRGEALVPEDERERADAALRCFLARVFDDRSAFEFDAERFASAYEELEHTIYEGRCVTVVTAPLHGIALDPNTSELLLDDGLSLVRGDLLPGAPPEAVWGPSPAVPGGEPCVLAVFRATQDRAAPAPVSVARARLRRILTGLRLFERGSYALGPLAWTRVDDGAWRVVPLGPSGRSRLTTRIACEHEDELRAFCSLIARRMPAPSASLRDPAGAESQPNTSGRGELAWALSRFEMGCERLAPFEALTDYLLALRALLEPEGPASGRLAQRLAVICAQPRERPALAERMAHAILLERAVIAGLTPARAGMEALVDEVAEHLRAILRDILCGHLDIEVRALADELLARAALAHA